jgi:hypothetical protein
VIFGSQIIECHWQVNGLSEAIEYRPTGTGKCTDGTNVLIEYLEICDIMIDRMESFTFMGYPRDDRKILLTFSDRYRPYF